MRKLKLKSKLIAGFLIMVLFVMIASTIVVSIIVRQQSEGMSNDQVRKAINIVQMTCWKKSKKF